MTFPTVGIERAAAPRLTPTEHFELELLLLLGKLTELRGGDTAGHTLRVTLYTLLCAEELQVPHETLLAAVKGALLHDIGKLVMPDRLLEKPGALTPEERAEMQQHVIRGRDIVDQSELLLPAINVVHFHHERFDGSGYPTGARGEQIPLEARLFALVDVFDALTTARSYKPALPVAEALRIMADERGSHFDPDLFDIFAALAPQLKDRLPADPERLKVLLLEHLSHQLAFSEISYLRERLLTNQPGSDGLVGPGKAEG